MKINLLYNINTKNLSHQFNKSLSTCKRGKKNKSEIQIKKFLLKRSKPYIIGLEIIELKYVPFQFLSLGMEIDGYIQQEISFNI